MAGVASRKLSGGSVGDELERAMSGRLIDKMEKPWTRAEAGGMKR